ncbi:MAG: hypothetical protein LBT75_03890 [Bacilli bacterium]|jgi:hypothetical protein|nr:hypothetical protein [Bacilli bacterium]
MIRTLEQAKILMKYHIKEVYVDNLGLLNKIKDYFDKIIPVLPRIIKDEYFDDIVSLVQDYPVIMVSDLGMLELFKNKDKEANYSLNISNEYGLKLLDDYQVNNVLFSLENMNYNKRLANQTTTSLGYGYQPLMIMEYCPINKDKNHHCLECTLCQEHQYYLKDEDHQSLPLVYHGYDILELFSKQPVINNNIQTNYVLISLTIEKQHECEKIIKKYL